MAVGGYGRGELAPCSDLDVVLVHEEGVDPGAVAADVWYPLWDSGSRLDHSVRSLPEMVAAADADLKVALGLLDVRHLAGDPNLTLRLRGAVLTAWRRDARDRLPDLRRLVSSRHELLGELAHLSVPDLKEAEGGLRDATVLKALVASWLVDVPHADLERSRRALLDVRDVLHETAGRATDRVAPEAWTDLAAGLGLDDERAAQVHVRELGRRIAHISRLTWRRLDAVIARRRTPARSRTPDLVPIGPGLALSGGEVVLTAGARPEAGPAAPAAGLGRGCGARRRAGAGDGGPAGAQRGAAARPVARRRPAAAGAAARRPDGDCSPSGRPWRRRARSPRCCRSGSGSGCSRTPRPSTGSPWTGTSSRRASRPRR